MLARIVFAFVIGIANYSFAQYGGYGQYYQNQFNNTWNGYQGGVQQQLYRTRVQSAQRNAIYARQTAAKRQEALAKKAYEREQKLAAAELRKQEAAYKEHLRLMKTDPAYAAEVRRREKEGLMIVGIVAAFVVGAAITADSFQWEPKSDDGEQADYNAQAAEHEAWARRTRVWRLESDIRNEPHEDRKRALQTELDAIK